MDDWMEINSEINFGETHGNYTTQLYVGGADVGDAPEELKQSDDCYINYDICTKAESNITGLDIYTCRLGEYDYLIHEIDGGDYPSHYVVFRQYHSLAPITCKEEA